MRLAPFLPYSNQARAMPKRPAETPRMRSQSIPPAAMFGDMHDRVGLNRVPEQKVLDRVLEKAQHEGHAGKDHHGDRHCPENEAMMFIFMLVSRMSMFVMMLFLDPALGQQNVENQTEAVIGGQNSPEKSGCKPDFIRLSRKNSQDGLFAEKTGEGVDPGERKSADRHAHHGYFQLAAALLADYPHVIGVEFMDEYAGAQKEKGLEPGVGRKVENPGEISAGGERHDHHSELAHRRISPDLFKIVCNHRHGGGEQHGDRTDCKGDRHGVRGSGEEGKNPAEHVNAGGDHGGRMEQGADRGGTFHCIGQPGKQRELGALADNAAEDQKGGDGKQVLRQSLECLRRD